MSSQTAFAKQIEDFVNKTRNTANDLIKELLVLLMSRIDQRSPIGEPKYWKYPAPAGYQKGLFRGSWMLGVNMIDRSLPNTRDPDRKKISVARGMTRIPHEAMGNKFFYTNSLPYALRLEYGWSYRQAPYGIIAVTSLEFKQLMARAVMKAKDKNVTG